MMEGQAGARLWTPGLHNLVALDRGAQGAHPAIAGGLAPSYFRNIC